MKVTAKVSNNHLRIHLDGVLHVSIDADEIVGVVSYKSCGYFHIDYYCGASTIETTYKHEDTWIAVLKELEKVNII
jgi:hypothetical protein